MEVISSWVVIPQYFRLTEAGHSLAWLVRVLGSSIVPRWPAPSDTQVRQNRNPFKEDALLPLSSPGEISTLAWFSQCMTMLRYGNVSHNASSCWQIVFPLSHSTQHAEIGCPSHCRFAGYRIDRKLNPDIELTHITSQLLTATFNFLTYVNISTTHPLPNGRLQTRIKNVFRFSSTTFIWDISHYKKNATFWRT